MLTFSAVYDILMVSRGGNTPKYRATWASGELLEQRNCIDPYLSVANFFQKNEKPLDNRHKMWYNQRAVRTGTH